MFHFFSFEVLEIHKPNYKIILHFYMGALLAWGKAMTLSNNPAFSIYKNLKSMNAWGNQYFIAGLWMNFFEIRNN
jgi:uncharacterized membrane protein